MMTFPYRSYCYLFISCRRICSRTVAARLPLKILPLHINQKLLGLINKAYYYFIRPTTHSFAACCFYPCYSFHFLKRNLFLNLRMQKCTGWRLSVIYFCFLSEGSYTWEWTGRARRAWCTSRPSALRTPARFSGLSRQDIARVEYIYFDIH